MPQEITVLSPAEEQQFQLWTKANRIIDVDHPDSHYDYRGFWKEYGNKPIKFGVDHFPDTYKQHGHPTFSVESKYSTGPNDGGRWQGDKFVPPQTPELKPASWEDVVTAAAKANGVNPALALAVAKKESSLNPDAVGDGGQALGMFQLHAGAATDTGQPNRADPIQNITGGVKYLRQLSDRYKGDVHKALMAYNGGMESVDAGTPSPAAQAYASDVIANLSASLRPATQEKVIFTDESKPIVKPPVQPTYGQRVQQIFQASPEGQMLEGLKGAGKSAAKRATDLYGMVQKRLNLPSIVPPVGSPSFSTELTNPAQKLGAGIEQAAEFAVPAGEVAKGAKALDVASLLAQKGAPLLAAKFGAATVEGLAQGAVGYGVSKAQGTTETGAKVNAALSAVGPVANTALELGAPAIRARAEKKLAQVFAKGVEKAKEMGPEIRTAIKTGNVTADVRDAVNIVQKAASDTLDLPLRASWGKWMAQNSRVAEEIGQDLGTAIKGPLGDEYLFKQPIIDALDGLAQTTSHLAETPTGSVEQQVHNKALFDQIQTLKNAINASGENLKGYGHMISVRNLTELKQTWDKVVYGLSTAGKVAISTEALTATAQKEATKVAADTIRAMFDSDTPTIAALNQAASRAYRLQDLTRKLYAASPGMGKTTAMLFHVGGAAAGAELARALPGGHTLYGIMAGGALANLMERAFESPAWQTLKPVVKGKLATAIANGDGLTARRIIRSIISTGVSQRNQVPPSAEARP